jgi:hypothetical protein
MSSIMVVVTNVFRKFLSRDSFVFERSSLQFGFDGSKTGFLECVVVAIVAAVHALLQLSSGEHGAVLRPKILSASVGVVDQVRRGLPSVNGPVNGG